MYFTFKANDRKRNSVNTVLIKKAIFYQLLNLILNFNYFKQFSLGCSSNAILSSQAIHIYGLTLNNCFSLTINSHEIPLLNPEDIKSQRQRKINLE